MLPSGVGQRPDPSFAPASMHKVRYHPPGTPPATLMSPHPVDQDRPMVAVMQYGPDHFEEQMCAEFSMIQHAVRPDRVTWIDVRGLGDVELLRQVGSLFHLHPLALEDVLNTTQRPKIEPFDECLFIVVHMVYFEGDSPEEEYLVSEQVSIFLGKDFVVTVQEEPCADVFEPVRERLRQGRGFARKMGPDYLVYALIDAVVDHFYPVLEDIGEGLEEMEEEIEERAERKHLRNLQEFKRMLLQMRRACWPCREILNGMLRDEYALIRPETKVFLRDCYDHAVQIIELTESHREMTADLVDLWMSGIGMRTNEIMRVLTVISSIFIPLTFVAGVYGMNFNPDKSPWNMPELDMYYGYPACLAAMAVVAVGMIGFFKMKKWL